MKKIKSVVILIVVLFLTSVALVGCGENDSYKIKINQNFPDGSGSFWSQLVTVGNSVDRPVAPSFDGYVFLGWATEPTATEPNIVFPYIPSKDVNFYAVWEKYTVEAIDLDFTLLPDNTYEVKSKGTVEYKKLKNLVIPSEHNGKAVTSIGNEAFKSCNIIQNVTIPSSVKYIQAGAFYDCHSLREIVIPDSVKSIERNAFFACNALNSVDIGDNVTNIGEYAFCDCSSLTKIVIGDSVTSIGTEAFSCCRKLENVLITNSVTSISKKAFYFCQNLKSVVIPDSVTNIGMEAFSYCSELENVVIPDSVTSISEKAFYFCQSLKSVVIPDSVTNIGAEAFCDCESLENLIIPDSVTSIGTKAFYDCRSLTTLIIGDGVTSINNGIFSDCYSLISVTIGKNVTSIDCNMFWGARIIEVYNFSNLEIVKNEYKYGYISSFALDVYTTREQSKLSEEGNFLIRTANGEKTLVRYLGDNTEVVIPEGIKYINDYAFSNNKKLENVIMSDSVEIIGVSAFYYCSNLKNIKFSENLKIIKSYAFQKCYSLTNVVMPDSVTELEDRVFINCRNLASLTINKNLIKAGVNLVYGCYSLAEIYNFSNIDIDYNNLGFKLLNIYTTGEPSKLSKEGDFLISTVNGEKTLVRYLGDDTEVVVPNNFSDIKEYAFAETEIESVTIPSNITKLNDGLFYSCYKLKKVVLTDELTEIGKKVFAMCEVLCDFKIPKNVTSIGDSAFMYCSSLKVLDISEDLISLGEKAFYGTAWFNSQADGVVYIGSMAIDYKGEMPSNANIEIKEGTTIISNGAFKNCKNLERITFPESLKVIKSNAFLRCVNLSEVTYPSGLEIIGDYAFSECESLSSVEIPDGVNYLGEGAFYGSKNLKTCVLGEGINEIGENAFKYCSQLKNVYYNGDIKDWLNIDFKNTLANPICYYACFYLNNEILIDLVVPDTVTQIKPFVFIGYQGLESVVFSDSVTYIGEKAFYGCDKINEINISENVSFIGELAFGCCDNIKSIMVDENNKHYKSENNVLYNKSGTSLILYIHTLNEFTFEIPNTVTTIKRLAFYNAYLKTIIIPSNVIKIERDAFYKMRNLENVYFNGSIEEWLDIEFANSYSNPMIEAENFYLNNELLTDLVIPKTVETIGTDVFIEYNRINIYAEATSRPSGWECYWDEKYYSPYHTVYYYSETQPTSDGDFWHYVDGVPTIW